EERTALVVTLQAGRWRGRGEASGVYYLGETGETMLAAVESQRPAIERGIDRVALQELLPPGGAPNALGCAVWELEAALAGRPVWKLAGLTQLDPLVTTFTLGADDPAVMVAGARRFSQARSLKLKLTGDLDQDIARIRAVRSARPEVWLGVDA